MGNVMGNDVSGLQLQLLFSKVTYGFVLDLFCFLYFFVIPNSVSVTRGRIFHAKNELVYVIHARFSFLYCFLRLKRRNFCRLKL